MKCRGERRRGEERMKMGERVHAKCGFLNNSLFPAGNKPAFRAI